MKSIFNRIPRGSAAKGKEEVLIDRSEKRSDEIEMSKVDKDDAVQGLPPPPPPSSRNRPAAPTTAPAAPQPIASNLDQLCEKLKVGTDKYVKVYQKSSDVSFDQGQVIMNQWEANGETVYVVKNSNEVAIVRMEAGVRHINGWLPKGSIIGNVPLPAPISFVSTVQNCVVVEYNLVMDVERARASSGYKERSLARCVALDSDLRRIANSIEPNPVNLVALTALFGSVPDEYKDVIVMRHVDIKISLLQFVRGFAHTTVTIDKLQTITNHPFSVRVQEVSKYANIVTAGEVSNDVFFLLAGKAVVYIGENTQLYVYEPMVSVFGERAIVYPGRPELLRRGASIRPITETAHVLQINVAALYEALTGSRAETITNIENNAFVNDLDATFKAIRMGLLEHISETNAVNASHMNELLYNRIVQRVEAAV